MAGCQATGSTRRRRRASLRNRTMRLERYPEILSVDSAPKHATRVNNYTARVTNRHKGQVTKTTTFTYVGAMREC